MLIILNFAISEFSSPICYQPVTPPGHSNNFLCEKEISALQRTFAPQQDKPTLSCSILLARSYDGFPNRTSRGELRGMSANAGAGRLRHMPPCLSRPGSFPFNDRPFYLGELLRLWPLFRRMPGGGT
jgi:hypothetical protein